MVHLYRLIVAALFFACAHAGATVVPVSAGWSANGGASSCGTSASLTEAFAACIIGKVNSVTDLSKLDNCKFVNVTSASATAQCHYIPNNNYLSNGGASALAAACPVNSTGTSTCTCNSGYAEGSGADAGKCIVAGAAKWSQWCAAASGQVLGSQSVYGKSVVSGCLGGINLAGSPIDTPGYQLGDLPDGAGCTVAIGDDRLGAQGADGVWHTVGTATGTGGTCVEGVGSVPGTVPAGSPSGTTGGPETAPAPCPAGQAPVTVNGQQICAPMGSDTPTAAPSPQSGTTTKNNADGTSTTTQTSGTTECKAGSCTTTNTVVTTTRGAAGNVTGTSSESTSSTQSLGAFCQANGKSSQCSGVGDGSGGSFSGDCASGFKADGDDPVLNAMALETYRQNCKVNPDAQSQALAKTEAAKDGTNVTGSNPNNSSVSIGSSNFDTSDALGLGGGCPADRVIPLWGGRSFALPWSSLCGSLQMMGSVLVAVSLLLAARIVTRG